MWIKDWPMSSMEMLTFEFLFKPKNVSLNKLDNKAENRSTELIHFQIRVAFLCIISCPYLKIGILIGFFGLLFLI